MINVTLENFDAEVVAASSAVPVLVDFWAPWCGPCKVIGPLLEKLETEYAGRFKLVKIDSDQEQELSQAFGIRSIPTCVLLRDGKPVDGFMGALPEGQIKTFLDKHVPSEAAVAATEEEDAALAALAAGDLNAALEKLQHAVATDPANDDARFDYVKLLLELDRVDDAKVAFAPVIAKAAQVQRLGALRRWMDAIDFATSQGDADDAVATLDTKLASNKRDFAARFAKAQIRMSQRAWSQAMDELLEILMRDKSWSDDLARKTFIAILDLIEPPKVKVADDEGLTSYRSPASYRRRLSSVILS